VAHHRLHRLNDKGGRRVINDFFAVVDGKQKPYINYHLHFQLLQSVVVAVDLREQVAAQNADINISLLVDLGHRSILPNTFDLDNSRHTENVSRHNLGLVLAFLLICVVFSGAVAFSLAQARGDQKAARACAGEFYGRMARRDFVGARSLLTRERQGVLSSATLARTWDGFESKHGILRKWEIAQTPTVYGNRVSIFPRYVEESRLLSGTKGRAGAGMLHLQPEDGAWKVGRLSIVP